MTKWDGELAECSVRTKLPTLLVPRDALFGSSINAIVCITEQPLMKCYIAIVLLASIPS